MGSLKTRDSEVKRKDLSEGAKLRLWTKAAGRCALCSAYLLDSRTHSYHTTKVGELAHIVGATSEPGSPRGTSTLSIAERANEENVLLLCHSCHRMVDDPQNLAYWTEDRLSLRKYEHEKRVLRVTDFSTLTQAIVITTSAELRGVDARISPRQVMEALIESNLVVHVDRGMRSEFVVELQGDPNREYFWSAGRDQIDTILEKAQRTAGGARVEHVAVFALAPIPLLVYLGSTLGNKLGATIFDRHRDRAGAKDWAWLADDREPTEFTVTADASARGSEAEDLVVRVAVSGAVPKHRWPDDVANFPVMHMEPKVGDPRPGLIESVQDLNAASRAWTDLLGKIETLYPRVERLHVLAAAPASLAIQMGRERMRAAHPEMIVYQLHQSRYIPTTGISDKREN